MTPRGGDPEPRTGRPPSSANGAGATAPPAPESRPAKANWMEKAAAVVYCIFCIEIGLFLLVYPWMASWDRNYLIQVKPSLTEFLTSVQFRGAVSGLGILNLFAALSEILALRRYSSR